MIGEPDADGHAVVAVNDTLHPQEIEASVRFGDGTLLSRTVHISPNDKVTVGRIPSAAAPALYEIEWSAEGTRWRNHYIAGPRPFDVDTCRSWYDVMDLRPMR